MTKDNKTDDRAWTEMYKRGYDNTAICFAYIPDFKNEQDIIDYTNGSIAGRLKANS